MPSCENPLCGSNADATSKCSGCKEVRYCSRDCQVAGWPAHKRSCKATQALNAILANMSLLSGGSGPLIAALPYAGGLSPANNAKLLLLRMMIAEKVQLIRGSELGAMEMWSSGFELILECPELLDQRVTCNNRTVAPRDMLVGYTLDWTSFCCRYCLNTSSPNTPRTLPDGLLNRLRTLADSETQNPVVRLLAAWAATTSLQFSGLDDRLVGLGIGLSNTRSPFMRDRVRYSRLMESLWTPQVRSMVTRQQRDNLEMIVGEARAINRSFVGMDLSGDDDTVVVSSLPDFGGQL